MVLLLFSKDQSVFVQTVVFDTLLSARVTLKNSRKYLSSNKFEKGLKAIPEKSNRKIKGKNKKIKQALHFDPSTRTGPKAHPGHSPSPSLSLSPALSLPRAHCHWAQASSASSPQTPRA